MSAAPVSGLGIYCTKVSCAKRNELPYTKQMVLRGWGTKGEKDWLQTIKRCTPTSA